MGVERFPDEFPASCEAAVRAALEPYSHGWQGEPVSEVACVTSLELPAADEVSVATGKAIAALGYAEGSFLLISTAVLSPSEVREVIEAVAPAATLCFERRAAADIAEVYGFPQEDVPVGVPIETAMRTFVVLSDFPGSLGDVDKKRAAWHEMQAARRKTSYQ